MCVITECLSMLLWSVWEKVPHVFQGERGRWTPTRLDIQLLGWTTLQGGENATHQSLPWIKGNESVVPATEGGNSKALGDLEKGLSLAPCPITSALLQMWQQLFLLWPGEHGLKEVLLWLLQGLYSHQRPVTLGKDIFHPFLFPLSHQG